MKLIKIVGFLLLALFLSGCSREETEQVVTPAMAAPSPTPRPTRTSSPLPPTFTLTPSPTRTPTLIPLTFGPSPISTQSASAISVKNASQIVEVAELGKGQPKATGWSPDGRYFTIESSRGLYVYETSSWEQVRLFDDFGGYVWSPTGRFLAIRTQSGSQRPGLFIYENSRLDEVTYIPNGQRINWSEDERWIATTIFKPQSNAPEAVHILDGTTLESIKTIPRGERTVWSDDKRWLAVTTATDIRLFDAATLEQIAVIQSPSSLQSLKFSPDGSTFVTLSTTDLRLWEAATGKLIAVLGEVPNDIRLTKTLTYSANSEGFLYAYTSDEGFSYAVSVWETSYGRLMYTQAGQLEYSDGLAAIFSPRERRLALVLYDQTQLINYWEGKIETLLKAPEMDEWLDGPLQAAFSANGKKFISNAGVFDAETGEWLSKYGFSSFSLSPDGKLVLYKSYNPELQQQELRAWDLANDIPLTTLPQHCSRELCAEISPDGQWFTTIDNAVVYIHEAVTGEKVQSFEFDPGNIWGLTFNPSYPSEQGYQLVTTQGKGWEIDSDVRGSAAQTFAGGTTAFSPDGQLLAFQSKLGLIQVMDWRTQQVVRNLTGVFGFIRQMTFSPDGKILAAGWSGSYTYYEPEECNAGIIFWDLQSAQLLREITEFNCGFVFGPQTNQITWVAGNDIRIADWMTGETVLRLTREGLHPEASYTYLAYSADGRWLAVGVYYTSEIDIWDMRIQTVARVLQGHRQLEVGAHGMIEGGIYGLSFSPQNPLLASIGRDCSLRLWDINTGKMLNTFTCPSYGMAFSPDGTLLAVGTTGGTVRLFGLPLEK